MKQFSIKDLEDFSGIKKHTIRVWELRYSLLQPKRTNTLVRRYSAEEVNVLLDVALLNQKGIKVSRIASMCDKEKREIVAAVEDQQLKAVHDLIISMTEMDSKRFDLVLDSCVLYWGIHKTINEVIYPFAERVGLLEKWDEKTYIENILLVKESIKRKLYLGIEKAPYLKEQNKSILLFLTPGEKQGLPLLFINYFLKMEGYTVAHLGNNVSLACLKSIIKHKAPHLCITTQFEKNKQLNFNASFNNLPSLFPEVSFLLVGGAASADAAVTSFKKFENIEALLKSL